MSEPTTVRGDPLRALRAFAQVARLGSVTRAADALGLSQPAVTLQLQGLAREHGVELLERSGRRLVPTPAGEALLALARPLVEGVDGLPQALAEHLRNRAPDALALAAGSVALERLVPPAVASRAPRSLAVRHAGGEAALALLRAGTVAIAVGSWLDLPGDIEFLPLLHSPARLLLPAGHALAARDAIAIDDLAGHALVLPRDRTATRQLVELPLARAGVTGLAIVETGDWHAVPPLVAMGQGISVSNALALGGAERDGCVVRALPPDFPARPYGVAVRRGRTPSTEAAAFIGALRETAERLAAGFG
jgi:DNA-binding transcriptional LysR family regulator